MKLFKREKIKDVPGYEGVYAVTNTGRVWSYRRSKFLKTYKDAYGYLRAQFSVKYKRSSPKLHQLVAVAFITNPENKPQVNHRNSEKADCRVCNLEWCTARENMQHATDMCLNKIFKLSYDDKIIATQLRNKLGYKLTDLAIAFGVTPPAILYIANKYWPLDIYA
jgi:hypothetical protein